MSFVRGANPIWFFNNLVGQPVDDTYWAFFLTNDMPYVNQAVYQSPNGTIWSDPIEFQANAGLPDNIFGDPDLVYRIEIRQGPSPSDPLIGNPIQNYIFGSGGGSSIVTSDPLITSENLITNPNFADILFTSPYTITSPGLYDIAPGWKLLLSGAGTITLNQGINDGASNIVGNPPYYLSINNSGFSAQLIQTFSNNGAIFSGGAIAVSLTANVSSPSQNLTVSYQPSPGGGSGFVINTFSISSSAFIAYKHSVNVPLSTNTDTGQNAFTNILFSIPSTGTTQITNIQITGQSVNLSSGFDPVSNSPSFQELSYERIVDQEFNVYKNSLLTQPKENLLVGWTFALNPYQFTTKTITNVPTFGYVADQTIIVQQSYVNAATGNSIATGQGTPAQNLPFVVRAVSANNQFAIIQYIDASPIAPYWNQILSSMVNANLSTSNSSAVKFKMRLIYRTTVPPTMAQHEPINTWTLGADPSFAIGWNALTPLNDPVYTLTTVPQNFSFDQFQLPLSSAAKMTLGIVIYTVSNLDIAPNSILFNRVSLAPNDFAIDASTETYDQTFRKCQYYFETSYIRGLDIGTITTDGMIYFSIPTHDSIYYVGPNTEMNTSLYKSVISVNYKVAKRDTPIFSFYSPGTGAISSIQIGVFSGGVYPPPFVPGPNPTNVPLSDFTIVSLSYKSISIRPNNSNLIMSFTDFVQTTAGSPPIYAIDPYQGEYAFQYIADSRMGL